VCDMDFLTKEEVEDFRKAFSLFDNDGSGTISSRELITAMQNLNLRPTEEEIESLLRVSASAPTLTVVLHLLFVNRLSPFFPISPLSFLTEHASPMITRPRK